MQGPLLERRDEFMVLRGQSYGPLEVRAQVDALDSAAGAGFDFRAPFERHHFPLRNRLGRDSKPATDDPRATGLSDELLCALLVHAHKSTRRLRRCQASITLQGSFRFLALRERG